MTSTIKVNTVTTESGSTLTLGESGKTIALASGASQTGFGRTGTVDWQTSIKTSATFSASDGEGYFVDTSSNAITANLPAGSVGAIVAFKDYAQNFDTNALTISANGSDKIEGQTFDLILQTEGQAVTLVFGDSTKGWQAVLTVMKLQIHKNLYLQLVEQRQLYALILKFTHLQDRGHFVFLVLVMHQDQTQ